MTRRPLSTLAPASLVRAVGTGAAGTVMLLLLAAACTSKQTAVGPGGECFLATDCAPGLVCLEQPNGTRQCGDDLSKVAGRPPPEGGAADSSSEAGEPDPVEAGPDTGQPPDPPADAGSDA